MEIPEIGFGKVHLVDAAIEPRLRKFPEAVSVSEWQRPEQHRFKNAEYRGARANAEGEHEDAHCGHPRIAAQCTDGLEEFGPQPFKQRPPTDITYLFLDHFECSKFDCGFA